MEENMLINDISLIKNQYCHFEVSEALTGISQISNSYVIKSFANAFGTGISSHEVAEYK
jgi:hypothetical protein